MISTSCYKRHKPVGALFNSWLHEIEVARLLEYLRVRASPA
jgi:hypothetical protein